MSQDFIIEFDYFENRNLIMDLLGKIADEHNNLTGFQIFINSIPTSLEFYVFLCYSSNSTKEIDSMKELLFPYGKYRPDLSFNLLFERIRERRFNSFGVLDSRSLKAIQLDFAYADKGEVPSQQDFREKYLYRLKKEGYDAFEKLNGGTTIFLSHSSKQKNKLESIIPSLNSKNELIWLDKYRLSPEENDRTVKKELAAGLNEATKVFFYITKDFISSSWCIFELELSFEISKEKKDYSLLMIIDQDIKDEFFKNYSNIVESITADNILFLIDDQDFEEQILNFFNKKVYTEIK
ncbi:toll/interleukin-1 receptor domain-containing protein [Schinkia azotoformans]|uniref:toll/interleukin-1 receptor domain-containing protein n=1 Tax=Schinkia azotoformans TaxID=1454 RepID=UPI002DB8B582|nr:toll/interleukin-1 receptor domain-containing protein [Schinkia azotoformans]MEC1717792.1 toll/interleukin-1 receptor domain-containing protein [Schinkia azotoformans]MEC1743576.1 toll/interleukin-1 receptor domain-containing protein [Schinkia azotoformans]MEC1746550.1 toll/interleukin-1 receptor domain-containing protein [Schinkia azotoformans]MEC1757806.1 toll/interleukin-1 receptor domain-containing protein [Schinkia azotoformans]MEC1769299.1 toll/interleukin-1 receptor domain-containing